jgi:hypothetical protein
MAHLRMGSMPIAPSAEAVRVRVQRVGLELINTKTSGMIPKSGTRFSDQIMPGK